MKNLFFLTFFWLLTTTLYAQTPTRFTLQGRMVDTTTNALPASTVMLLSLKDSSMINFTRADEKGAFAMKGVRPGSYLLKVSFVGYIPFNQLIKTGDTPVIELGDLKMKPITKELFEVVVRTAKAPLTIKGDTIEYNAASFKVPPGSTVEDLLRKLPGVQVDQDGNIRAQGQEVKKVTVDGKSFFGDDPKLATKNLQADAITKVQVFNDKTEQAKLTGVDDGKKEKTVNLELKEEFKKGGFGKATVAAGPASNGVPTRFDGKANYNKFDSKQQLSGILLGNNTNQGGLSFNDYQDFRGSNSFNWNDNADFGFGGGGSNLYFGDDNESLSIPVGGGNGRGFTRNLAGGLNYNYDTKKTKLSSSYFFNQTKLDLNALRENRSLLPNNIILRKTDTSGQANTVTNHRVSIRYEKQLDSLQTLIYIGNGRFGLNSNNLSSTQRIFQSTANAAEFPTTFSLSTNNSAVNQFAMANTLLYRRKFKKKNRSLGISGTYQITKNDGDLILRAQNQFFQATSVNEQLRIINQDQNTNTLSNQYKANLLFVEPFAKKFFWETFYNFNLRFDEIDRGVSNLDDGRRRVDSLSVYYKNNYLFNRLGSSIRYSYKGVNLSVGLAGQQFILDGRYARDASQPLIPLRRTYTTVIPNVSLNMNLKNNKYIGANYSVDVQIPSSRDLQPVTTNSNPLYVTKGNPDLLPQLGHRLSAYVNHSNSGTFFNIYGSVNATYFVNQIVYSQTIDPQTLITTTMPENLTGGRNVGGYVGMGFPLKKTKVTLDLNSSLNFGHNLTRINYVLNETNNQNYRVGGQLELTPVDWLTFYVNTNFGITNTRYSINTGQNQSIYNNTLRGDLTLKLPAGIYLNSTMNYTTYRNDKLNFYQQIPILNTSVFRVLGKAKKAEIRLSGYDLLNRNVVVSQYAGQNYTSTERIQTLARYFLLSFTYNMRGVSAKMRRDYY